MQSAQNTIKQYVRKQFSVLARLLNHLFGDRLSPDAITWIGFLAHFPIGYCIATDHLVAGGVLLIFFGLFDTLDGALAREQKRSSTKGMFLDASTDRFKEVLLYTAATFLFIDKNIEWAAVTSCLVCGLSLSVSYVKAKGEAAIALGKTTISHERLNRMFGDGVASFEIRIALFALGCLSGQLAPLVAIIAILTIITVIQRFTRILRALT